MKKISKLLVFLLPFSVAILSCHPEYDATVEELDLAITKYNEDQDFGKLQTFYLPDTIMYIGDDEETLGVNVDHSQEDHILAQVRQNLLNIGWTEVEKPADGEIDSDVSIMVSVLETDITFYYYYWWDYWYWYPWYPYSTNYWWGYPIWPGYPIYPGGSITVGTVFIDMVNMDEIVLPTDPENPKFDIPIVWTGAINGILSGSKTNIESRLTTEISQVFDQSTYLHKKSPK